MAAVVALFLATVAGSGVWDTVDPLPRPELRGLEAAREARLEETARFADGSLARLAEHRLKVTSRVRDRVGGWYAGALFRLAREARGRAVVGATGWPFLMDRAFPRRGSDEGLVTAPAERLEVVGRRFAERDVQLVLAIVPRKAVVAAERLPRGADARPDLYPRLVDELGERGLVAVDLLTAMRESCGADCYYPYDTHWTHEGVRVAAEAIAREAGLWVAPTERTSRLRPGPPFGRHGSLRYLGLETEERRMRRDGEGLAPTWRVVSGKKVARPPSAVVVGSSFSEDGALAAFLGHYCDCEVESAAEGGLGSVVPLRRRLSRAGDDPLPPVVVWEIPAHELFRRPFAGAGGLFADLPPLRTVSVDGARGRWQAELGERIALGGRWRPLATLPGKSGGLDETAPLALRLRARRGGDVFLRLRPGRMPYALLWDADAPETLVLPAVGWRPGSRIRLEGRASAPTWIEVDEVELVREVGRGEP